MGSLGTTEIPRSAPAAFRAPEWPPTPPSNRPSTQPSTQQPPTRRPATRLAVVSALAGLLCGALAVGGLWVGGALLDEPAAVPRGDAAVACAILERLPTLTAENLEPSNASRLYAASELSAVAAQQDGRYRRLAEATRRAALSSSEADVSAVNQQVRVAVTECGR